MGGMRISLTKVLTTAVNADARLDYVFAGSVSCLYFGGCWGRRAQGC